MYVFIMYVYNLGLKECSFILMYLIRFLCISYETNVYVTFNLIYWASCFVSLSCVDGWGSVHPRPHADGGRDGGRRNRPADEGKEAKVSCY